MNNVKKGRHAYLCNFPLNLWTFINDQASKHYLTVAAYLNQLVFEEWQRCSYGEGGLFPVSDREEKPAAAESSFDDLFEKKVGDVVNSKEYGEGIIRTVNNKRRFFEVHFFSCDEIAPNAVQLFNFEDYNYNNFLLNWCRKSS